MWRQRKNSIRQSPPLVKVDFQAGCPATLGAPSFPPFRPSVYTSRAHRQFVSPRYDYTYYFNVRFIFFIFVGRVSQFIGAPARDFLSSINVCVCACVAICTSRALLIDRNHLYAANCTLFIIRVYSVCKTLIERGRNYFYHFIYIHNGRPFRFILNNKSFIAERYMNNL